MAGVPSYAFYMDPYFGVSIKAADWPRLSTRADEQVAFFERVFTVSGDDTARGKAVCAIADSIYSAELAASELLSVDESGTATTSSVSIGSVSTSSKAPDVASLGMDLSERGQADQFYQILCRYMDVYRGVGR